MPLLEDVPPPQRQARPAHGAAHPATPQAQPPDGQEQIAATGQATLPALPPLDTSPQQPAPPRKDRTPLRPKPASAASPRRAPTEVVTQVSPHKSAPQGSCPYPQPFRERHPRAPGKPQANPPRCGPLPTSTRKATPAEPRRRRQRPTPAHPAHQALPPDAPELQTTPHSFPCRRAIVPKAPPKTPVRAQLHR